MKTRNSIRHAIQSTLIASSAAACAVASVSAHAEDLRAASAPTSPPPAAGAPETGGPGAEGAERVNVDLIKEKYWARGDESEIGVVQNRLYSKEHKIELGIFGGNLDSTPFLTVRNLGASVGYHLSEYFSLTAVGWKAFSSSSDAAKYFLETKGGIAPTNPPKAYFGLELGFSPIYGKLSLIGKKIIYYDLHLLGAAGATMTEVSTCPTVSAGIGQQIYLSKWTSLRLDYRLMYYRDNPPERQIVSKLGQGTGERAVFTHAVTAGVTFLFGFGKKDAVAADEAPAAGPSSPGAVQAEPAKPEEVKSEKKNDKKRK